MVTANDHHQSIKIVLFKFGVLIVEVCVLQSDFYGKSWGDGGKHQAGTHFEGQREKIEDCMSCNAVTVIYQLQRQQL